MTFFDFIRKNIVTIFLSLIELTASGTLYRVFEDSFSKNILKIQPESWFFKYHKYKSDQEI